jgi:hypothetical protein
MTDTAAHKLASRSWRAGRRVSRSDKLEQQEHGTIVAANGEIKVKWDSGQTSYYRRKVPANIQLDALIS